MRSDNPRRWETAPLRWRWWNWLGVIAVVALIMAVAALLMGSEL